MSQMIATDSKVADICVELTRSLVRRKLCLNYLAGVRLVSEGGGDTFNVHDVEQTWAVRWLTNWNQDKSGKL